MERVVTTSAFGTVPVVVFQRLHVETNEPISLHTIVFQSAAAANAKAHWIQRQPHLALVGTSDATFDDSPSFTVADHDEAEPEPEPASEYSIRLREIHDRIVRELGEKPVVFYSAYKSDDERLPIDNLDTIAVAGKVKFIAEHDPFWADGSSYESDVVDSPTWLKVAVLANAMIKTTGDYHHQFLENVYIVDEEAGVKIANFGMGS